jgi:asparagine synthase (glutamine-hydrolysing)
VGIGIQRLRVIDLETGDQPIYNEDRSIAVVLNGEIYNYRELRAELEEAGHRFATRSDTEVIAHLYEEHGSGLVERLHGMFAFAVWDGPRRTLLLARDRVGKKPLYYHETDGELAFASELNALMADTAIPRRIDPGALDAYLAYGYVPAPLSIWNGVRKLEPAHLLTWKRGQAETSRYWSLDYSEKVSGTPRELGEELRRLIEGAVRRRMIADVPLGAFLSGGMDSSIVVAEMARASDRPVRTYSIGFDEPEYDERAKARAVAELFSTDHHEEVIRPDAIGALPEIAQRYGEPYADSSALPSLALAEFARRGVTVALNGDGGDENFAGYLRYTANAATARIEQLPLPVRSRLARVGESMSSGMARRGARAYAQRFLAAVDEPLASRYASHVSIFNATDRANLLNGAAPLHSPEQTTAMITDKYERATGTSVLDRLLEVDVHTYLPDDLLVKVDIATMAHSLEARSPLLDHTVMEFAASLPTDLKALAGRRKRLLRIAYDGLLPESTLHGRKMGFAVPLDHWFRGKLGDYAEEVLLDPSAATGEYLNGSVIRGMLTEHQEGRGEASAKLWSLLCLEWWHRTAGADGTG